ncbi:PP2C family serine/threonine-protein phosphatase [Paraburkholderia sp. C35]|uniref:protein phosphatase 2C domain-containing protein n=1 Tax=Paraburkholderia sp. C35 TaxID=2126993 RepID=UPI0013A5710A|nr:PP2C family serine/threonine-protein phosphatase [Paraburkholderia sp. C35]
MLSDVGCVRDHNEDAVGCMIPRSEDPFALRGALAVIADGMGGHAAGEVASQIALRTILHDYYRDPAAPADALYNALVAANAAIVERATLEPDLDGMGTTCSVVAVIGDVAYIANVGDSRIYLLREETLTQLTDDDSLVAEMLRDGLLSAEEAEQHPDKNVILRALGTHDFTPTIHADGHQLLAGDRLMLCTDGISDQIDHAMLESVVARLAPIDACSELIELARRAGGIDNASVGIIELQPAAAGTESAPHSTRSRRAYGT